MHDIELVRLERLSPLAYHLHFQLLDPPLTAEPFQFRPGQWVYLIDAQGFREDKRAFSLASTPADPSQIELAIEIVPKGLFSPRVPQWKAGERFTIRGPYGVFVLPVTVDAPLLLCGMNSGIVPLMSMIRTLFNERLDYTQRCCCQFWYSTPEVALFHAEVLELAATHPRFLYYPKDTGSHDLSQIDPEWLRATLVEGAVDPATTQVFAAGLSVFLTPLTGALEAYGFPPAAISTERYD